MSTTCTRTTNANDNNTCTSAESNVNIPSPIPITSLDTIQKDGLDGSTNSNKNDTMNNTTDGIDYPSQDIPHLISNLTLHPDGWMDILKTTNSCDSPTHDHHDSAQTIKLKNDASCTIPVFPSLIKLLHTLKMSQRIQKEFIHHSITNKHDDGSASGSSSTLCSTSTNNQDHDDKECNNTQHENDKQENNDEIINDNNHSSLDLPQDLRLFPPVASPPIITDISHLENNLHYVPKLNEQLTIVMNQIMRMNDSTTKTSTTNNATEEKHSGEKKKKKRDEERSKAWKERNLKKDLNNRQHDGDDASDKDQVDSGVAALATDNDSSQIENLDEQDIRNRNKNEFEALKVQDDSSSSSTTNGKDAADEHDIEKVDAHDSIKKEDDMILVEDRVDQVLPDVNEDHNDENDNENDDEIKQHKASSTNDEAKQDDKQMRSDQNQSKPLPQNPIISNSPSTKSDKIHKDMTNNYINDSTNGRTQAAFNSIYVLLPILKSIIDHPHQQNKQIKMRHGNSLPATPLPDTENKNNDKKTKKKKRKKIPKMRYLFSEGVYSLCSEGQMKMLRRYYAEFVELYQKMVMSFRHDDTSTTHVAGCIQSFDDLISLIRMGAYSRDIGPTSVLDEGESIENTSQNRDTSTEPKVNDNEETHSSCSSSSFPSSPTTAQHDNLLQQAQAFDTKYIQPLSNYQAERQRSVIKSVLKLKDLLHKILSKQFRGIKLTIYGSCLSGLVLSNSFDVDISLDIPKRSINRGPSSPKKLVWQICYLIKNYRIRGIQQFDSMNPVAHARVPLVQGRYLYAENPLSNDGSIHFDICFSNDIAIRNSNLIQDYSKLDNRVRMLMLCVKAFAKYHNIGSAKDGTLSSYTWMILVIFYLQVIGFVPNLQCPKFMKLHGLEVDGLAVSDSKQVLLEKNDGRDDIDPTAKTSGTVSNSIHLLPTAFVSFEEVQRLGKWKPPAEFNDIPVSMLLAGFFSFYKQYPYTTTAISMRIGKPLLQKTVFDSSKLWRFAIEDPFETHFAEMTHDLGVHMMESGQKKVMQCFISASDVLENVQWDDEIRMKYVVNALNVFGYRKKGPKDEQEKKMNEGQDHKSAALPMTQANDKSTQQHKADTTAALSHVIIPKMERYVTSFIEIIQLKISECPSTYKILVSFPTAEMVTYFRMLLQSLGIQKVFEYKRSTEGAKKIVESCRISKRVIILCCGFAVRDKFHTSKHPLTSIIQFGIPQKTSKYISDICRCTSSTNAKELIVLAPFESSFLEKINSISSSINEKVQAVVCEQVDPTVGECFENFLNSMKTAGINRQMHPSFVRYYKSQFDQTSFTDEVELMNTANDLMGVMGIKEYDVKPEASHVITPITNSMNGLVSHVVIPNMDRYVISFVEIIQSKISEFPESFKILCLLPTTDSISATYFQILFQSVLGIEEVFIYDTSNRKKSQEKFRNLSKAIMLSFGSIGRGEISFPGGNVLTNIIQFGIPPDTEKYISIVKQYSKTKKSRIEELIVLGPFEAMFLEDIKCLNSSLNTKVHDMLCKEVDGRLATLFDGFLTKMENDDKFVCLSKAKDAYISFLYHCMFHIDQASFTDEQQFRKTLEQFASLIGLKNPPNLEPGQESFIKKSFSKNNTDEQTVKPKKGMGMKKKDDDKQAKQNHGNKTKSTNEDKNNAEDGYDGKGSMTASTKKRRYRRRKKSEKPDTNEKSRIQKEENNPLKTVSEENGNV